MPLKFCLAQVPLLVTLCCSGPAWADPADRPVYARPATTATGMLLEGFVESFDGLDLQEAVQLEGWTAGLDLTFPFRRGMQLRFLLPVRTEADGVFRSNRMDVEIEGWGGTFDFASLFFEHQVVGTEGGPDRVSWFAGVGQRTGVLKTGTPDRYNHEGRSVHVGVRYDRVLTDAGTLFLDTEVRYYDPSDDLNPGDLLDDTFWFGTITAAWLGPPSGPFTPGVELMADVGEGHFAASLVPELIVSAGAILDLKLAVPVGVSSDAPDWGAQFRMTLAF